MKAMVLHEIGGPDSLSYEDAPDPEPGPGETVVRLHAAASTPVRSPRPFPSSLARTAPVR